MSFTESSNKAHWAPSTGHCTGPQDVQMKYSPLPEGGHSLETDKNRQMNTYNTWDKYRVDVSRWYYGNPKEGHTTKPEAAGMARREDDTGWMWAARQEGVERIGFLNKGNCRCKGSEVKDSKTLVGISKVRAHTMGRKMTFSAGAVMKALFGELPRVCKSLRCDESG